MCSAWGCVCVCVGGKVSNKIKKCFVVASVAGLFSQRKYGRNWRNKERKKEMTN